jgi:hypothetical protein
MEHKLTTTQKRSLLVIIWIVIAILFGLAYTQTPLYEGNQNTKFLHGLARAGEGYLKDDWLANTIDPLPVFSFLVAVTDRINPDLFYLEYILMFGIYVFSLHGILTHLFRAQNSLVKQSIFLGIIFLLHARWPIWWVGKAYGFDLSLFHNGLALQYLLGLEFQTNVFGVLLLLSIYLFFERRIVWAFVMIGVAGLVHPAYLFGGALLTIAYCLIVFWRQFESSFRARDISLKTFWEAARWPIGLGVVVLVLVLPVIIYNQIVLAPTSAEIYEQAMQLLIVERIPHHSLPSVWLGRSAYLQIGIILVGILILLLRKSPLATIMLVLSIGAALFTMVQIITGSLGLAALAPWRVSVILVPLSSVIILSTLAMLVISPFPYDHRFVRPVIVGAVVLGILGLAYSGYKLQQTYGTSFRDKRVTDMMDFVLNNKRQGELYLIPPKEPDLNNFRLYTGAPIFINWKSHPYKDTELLEWYDRVQIALAFYNAEFSDQEMACALLDDIVNEYGVTQVVVKRKDAVLDCDFVHPTYVETKFTIFEIDRVE